MGDLGKFVLFCQAIVIASINLLEALLRSGRTAAVAVPT
jgi:hypothetical protein